MSPGGGMEDTIGSSPIEETHAGSTPVQDTSKEENQMTYSELSDSELVAKIYSTVNELNDMIYHAARNRKFTVQYSVVDSRTIEMFASYPHMDMRILTEVK